MAFFKLGNVHVPHRKNTKNCPGKRIEPPKTVEILMAQHIGAPANPTVKEGDEVFVGTLIGEASSFVSANIHSSVSGTVKKIDSRLTSNGRFVTSVIIESDGKMTPDPTITPPTVTSFEELSAAVRASGLVGLGGAGFPTSVKLDPKRISEIDTILINGAECEPYITSDTRTMLDDTDEVIRGISALLHFSGIPNAIIAIEKNKPECIEALTEAALADGRISVLPLPSTYPQGGEKVLIFNATGRAVPAGKLPADVGVLIMNVTSVAFLAKYLKTGMPLVEKCITVDGSAVKEPKNLIVPIGTSIADVIEAAGGLSEDAGKILYGGPMMGISVYSTEDPILKNTNAITVLNKKDAKARQGAACIHCGRCVSACPMGLNPTAFAKALNLTNAEDRAARLTAESVSLCIECGCCSFVCPAKRPLVENNRLAKSALRDYEARKTSK